MDSPSPGHIAFDISVLLMDSSRRTKVEDLRKYVKNTSARLLVANLLRQAGSGSEDEVFASFPRLAESDQLVMSRACEYLQVNPFNVVLNRFIGKRSGLRREQKLNFFRLAQRIRDEHRTARETPPPKCFQTFEDIVELERTIEINNCVEFMIHCVRLDLVDGRHVDQMFESTSTVEQLAALYDEIVPMLERYCRNSHEKRRLHSESICFPRYNLGIRFQLRFVNIMRSRPYERPLWRDSKMYLERAADFTSGARFVTDVDIPDADLDEALSCLLTNAGLFTIAGHTPELTHLLNSLLIRGASLYHRDQHGVSSLRRLLGLGDPYIEHEPLQTSLTYTCCPLKYVGGRKIIADNRRPAPLSCLAARRIPPSTIEEQLPRQLRPSVRSHRELQEVLTRRLRDPEPVDKWRQPTRPRWIL